MKQKDLSRPAQRGDRLLREQVHDPYKTRLKLSEPTVCPSCNAVYSKGRWHWGERPYRPHEETCKACRRIKDDCPAGIVRLSGGFLKAHKDEVFGLIRNQEALEKGEHPLNRIMSIAEEDGEIVIKTTDIHLPRRIGEALRSAYEGTLDYRYEEETYFLRVAWSREA